MQVDYIGQERSRAAGNYSTPQLLVDLAQEIKPDKKRRQNIRKAMGQGVEIGPVKEGELEGCARLSSEFGAHHGIRSQELGFLRMAYGSGIAKMFAARLRGELLGFEIILLDRELGKTYSWLAAWNGKGLETNAPSLLTLELIKWSKENGFRWFDFGGIDFETEKKRNIAFFKQSFGGSLTSYRSARTLAFRGATSKLAYKLIYHAYHKVYVPLHDRKRA